MLLFNTRMFRKIQRYNIGKHQNRKFQQIRSFVLDFVNTNDKYYTLFEVFNVMYSISFGYKPHDINKMLKTMRKHKIHEKFKDLYTLGDGYHQIYNLIRPKYPLYIIARYIDLHWNSLCNNYYGLVKPIGFKISIKDFIKRLQ